ncbi:hypothetical protein Q7P37_006609 [Cladosporium fusiforme]
MDSMEPNVKPSIEGNVRVSDSPRRSPHVTHSVTSPVRSVHPEMLESIDSQADFGSRTADFFDDTTSDEDELSGILEREASGVEENLLNRGRHSQSKRRASRPQTVLSEPPIAQTQTKGRSSQPEGDGYQRLSPVKIPQETTRYTDVPDTPSTSFNGSITELLPGEHGSSPPQYPKPARFSDFGRPHSTVDPRSETAYRSSSVMPMPVANKVDQVLSAHAIAHEITLQALMRDENTLDRTIDSFTPMHPGERGSLLPASLRINDPRSPGSMRKFSAPSDSQQTPGSGKRVHVVPPPIDTSGPRPSLPASLVRTPYPFEGGGVRHKYLSHMVEGGQNLKTPLPSTESVLTLSIRPSASNSRRRVTSIVIPSSNILSTIRSAGSAEKEKHFRGLEFDDEEFFRQLKQSYVHLSGPWRILSARSLKRIVVSGVASKAADAGYGWLHSPRSPRELAFSGLKDTFSEDKILAHYYRPAMGRSRYAFVQWAHRLAAVEDRQAPFRADERNEGEGNLVRKLDQPEGLEFVLSWSILRLSLALLLVLFLAVAAVLLWTFLGRNTTFDAAGSGEVSMQGGGFMGAGDRVGTGLAMGICVLLVGLSSIAGWMGVSWLVI